MARMSFGEKVQEQFKDDMEEAGYDVEEYQGRMSYYGYAVRCDRSEREEVQEATKVRTQYDTMGKSGVIVYPSSKGFKHNADDDEDGYGYDEEE